MNHLQPRQGKLPFLSSKNYILETIQMGNYSIKHLLRSLLFDTYGMQPVLDRLYRPIEWPPSYLRHAACDIGAPSCMTKPMMGMYISIVTYTISSSKACGGKISMRSGVMPSIQPLRHAIPPTKYTRYL